MSKPKKNLMPLLNVLDGRADNYFAYDKDEQCYVIAQTWHVRVHKKDTPADQYEVVYFRAARRFDTEPSQDDITEFGRVSEQGLNEHMAAGVWTAGTIQDGKEEADPEPFEFDKWFIKDFREA